MLLQDFIPVSLALAFGNALEIVWCTLKSEIYHACHVCTYHVSVREALRVPSLGHCLMIQRSVLNLTAAAFFLSPSADLKKKTGGFTPQVLQMDH